MVSNKERAHTCVSMIESAMRLMEQICTEAGSIRSAANTHADHRVVSRTLERMQQKYLRVYEGSIDRSTK